MAPNPAPTTTQASLPGDGEEISVRAQVMEIYHRAQGRDYVVMLVKTEHGVVRALGPAGAIAEKATVLLTGRFRASPAGKEFHFKSARVLSLEGAGLIALLAQRFGITLPEAEVLARRFGPEAPARLDADPDIVEEATELPEATRKKITATLRRGGGSNRELLRRGGAREASINALVAAYGDGLGDALNANPYLPCLHAEEPLGTGDRLSQLFQRTTTDNPPMRVAAAIMERLRAGRRAGHVTREDLDLSAQAGKLLQTRLTPAQFNAGIEILVNDARIQHQGGLVALADAAAGEMHLIEELKRIAQAPGERPHITGPKLLALARDQGVALTAPDAEHIAKAFTHSLLVVPFTLARHGGFFLMLARVFSLLSAEVTVIAPTQQVKRLAQSLGHPVRHVREITETTRLNGDYVLVLEADRLSLPELRALTHAIDAGTSLWLAGEPRRVGGATPGQVLRDLYACAGVARLQPRDLAVNEITRELDELFRHGAPEHPSPALDGHVHVIYATAAEILEAVAVLGQELLPSLGYASPLDVLFVCPAKRTDVNVGAVNAVLGDVLKRAFPAPGVPCVLDGQVSEALRRGERGVVAGAPRAKRLGVQFEDLSIETYANQLTSGYCVSAHRAGGLLARVVVWVAIGAHGALLNRELLFSATSGAIEHVFLLAEREALERTLTTPQPEVRTGWFAELARATL